MRTLMLTPDRQSYSLQAAAGALASVLQGPGARYRETDANGAVSIDVQWTCTASDYFYLRAFYRYVARRGVRPFLVELMVATRELTLHKAWIVPGSLTTSSVDGRAFRVSATLEVDPRVVT